MPGRPRTTRSTGATAGRKSSTTTLKSRGSSARTSAHAVEIPDEGPDTTLRQQICQVFSEAQKNTMTQRKLVVTLRKIQEACLYVDQNPQKKRRKHEEEIEDFDAEQFNAEFTRCLLRIMVVKKSEPAGDRIVKFTSMFLKYALEKDQALVTEDDMDPELETTKLVNNIVTMCLELIVAKEKTVRFRAAQVIANVLNSVDTVDDTLFGLIKIALLKRLKDKESSVRCQAAFSLSRLGLNDDDDDEDSDDEEAGSVMAKLVDVMQNDPSADVRRVILQNMHFLKSTMPFILERARDTDPQIRRLLYAKILPLLGDFRHLALHEREKLLRWGLRDRDEAVRQHAAKLFRETWIDTCTMTLTPPKEGEERPPGLLPPNVDALCELLERIHVTFSGVDGGIAHEAMREFWTGRPDYVQAMEFDDDFWNDLSAESAFIARSLNDYAQGLNDIALQETIEEKLPTMHKFAFFINKHLNILITGILKLYEDGENTDLQTAVDDREFMVEQLLHIALTLDYSDEVGRRTLSTIMREALMKPALPEGCTQLAVEVLRMTCGSRAAGETEFISLIQEAINEVKDTLADDDEETEQIKDNESFHSAQSDQSELSTGSVNPRKKAKLNHNDEDSENAEVQHQRKILVYFKCLHIADCMLKNINCKIPETGPLSDILNHLIIPAIRSDSGDGGVLRDSALVCLGLACMLNENLAQSNFQLFAHVAEKGNEDMQVKGLQVLCDLCVSFPALLAPVNYGPDATESEDAPNPNLVSFSKVLIRCFKAYSNKPTLSLTACTAASKLLLLGRIPADTAVDILKIFAIEYFNPDMGSSPGVRQALSYFLPVFCLSRQENATMMAQCAVHIISKLISIRDEILDEEEEDMVGWPVIAGQLAEWTDGRRVVGATELGLDGKMETTAAAEKPHMMLAVDILERCLGKLTSKDERKPLLTLLSKLHISATKPGAGEEVDEDTLRTLHSLTEEAVENQVWLDATTRNCVTKLATTMAKRIGDVERVTPAADAENDAEREEAETGIEDEGEQTEVPGSRAQTVEPDTAAEEEEEEEEEEDTMLANVQAESTRYPLHDEDGMDIDEDDEDTTVVPVRSKPTPVKVKREKSVRPKMAVTEDDIMASLLESEME